MTTLADINKTLERIEKSDDVNQALLGRIGVVMDEQLRLLKQQRSESEKSELLGLEASREAQRQTLARQIGQRQDADGLEGVELEQGAFRGSFFGNLLSDLAAPLTGLLGLMGLRQIEGATGRVRRGVGLGRMLGGAALVSVFLPQIQALGEAIGSYVGGQFELNSEQQSNLNDALGNALAAGIIFGPLASAATAVIGYGLNSIVDDQGNLTINIPGINKEMEDNIAKIISTPAFQIAIGSLAASIIPKILASFPLALATIGIGSVTAAFKYYTDEDFKKQVDEFTEPVRKIFRDIGSFFSRTVISIGRAIKDKLFRTTEVTQEEINLRQQLDNLIEERKRIVAEENPTANEILNLPITAEIERVDAELRALQNAGNEEAIRQMRNQALTEKNRALGLGALSASELEESRALARTRAAVGIQELINAQRAAADINSGAPGGFMYNPRLLYNDNSQQTAQSIFMNKSTAVDNDFSWSFGPQRPFGR